MADEATLRKIFESFCSFGDRGGTASLDNVKFSKLCRDCNVVDRRVTKTDVDLTFTKVKPRDQRRINFELFKKALQELAKKKYPGTAPDEGYAQIVHHIIAAGGPKAQATSTATGGIYDKLTDSSQYTGAHKHRFDESGQGRGLGGRDSIGKGGGHAAHHGGAVNDLSQITRQNLHVSSPPARSAASTSARAAPTSARGAPTSARSRTTAGSSNPASARSASGTAEAAPASAGAGGSKDLRTIYHEYCCFGNTGTIRELDGAKMTKLCRDAKVVDKSYPSTAVDLVFAKVKTKGRRTINYDQFESALRMIGSEKYRGAPDGYERVVNAILATGGPQARGTGTTTKGNIFSKLTDSSQYTGAHKHRFDSSGHGRGIAGRESVGKGTGPGKYHGGAVSDLSQITRSNLS